MSNKVVITSDITCDLNWDLEQRYGVTTMPLHIVIGGKSYEDALKDAQIKGFAEADPTADVEGLDAANKLSILISLIFGVDAAPDVIPTQGITSVAIEDIRFAADSGFRIKLLASAREVDGKVYGNVEPVLLPVSHPLASVSNEFNAVFVSGNAVDDLMFYGRGAGPLPTGSAVLGDVIGVARKLEKDSAYDLVPQLRYDSDLEFAGEGTSKYCIRMMVPERAGILGKISTIFGDHNISVETVRQNSPYISDGEAVADLIFIVFKLFDNVSCIFEKIICQIFIFRECADRV